MSSTAADPQAVLAATVRDRIWRYLSANAAITHDLAPFVEDVFRLPRGEMRRLGATHVALRPETREMLGVSERLLRELPSAVRRLEVEASGSVRPPISWSQTFTTRARTRRAGVFICRSPLRQYDTALARMLKLSLLEVARLESLAGLPGSGETGEAVSDASRRALRLLGHAKLEDVRVVQTVPASTLRIAARHSASSIARFHALFTDAVVRQSPEALREVISSQLLAPSEIDRLFELFVGFELIDGLIEAGFQESVVRLIPGKRVPLSRLRRGSQELEVWWQTPIWRFFPGLRDTSAYRQALEQAGLQYAPLRPDFVVVDAARRSALIVEVKFTSLDDRSPDRRGVQDALMYLRDAMAVVEELPLPHALVAAWNSRAVPRPHRVVVCDQETVRDGIRLVVDSWGSFS
jgi:hypothetical protein